MGFKFKFTKNSKKIKKIFESISSIIEEAYLEFSPEGLKITAMDTSHICLVALTINKEDIEISDIEETEKVALNLTDLNKIINRCRDKEIISFYKKEKGSLNIIFSDEEKNKNRQFKLVEIDLDLDAVSLDSLFDIPFDHFFKMNTKDLDDIIKDAIIFADYLNIKKEKNTINFNCMGVVGDMENVWTESDFIEYTLNDSTTLNNIYGIDYLTKIIKASSFVSSFSIKMAQNLPIVFESDLFETSSVLYFLAPRTEDDDSDDVYDD